MARALHIVLSVLLTFSMCGNAAAQSKKFILVIDPGHGGEDPGATHGRLLEKDVNLRVALALGALIEKEMSDVEVLYTRKDDRAVGLAARGDFANRAGADLFLSIHTNSNRSSSPTGSETYVMGMDRSQANLEVAKLENEVIKYEPDYTETYAGFDPTSTEMSIIFGMLQYAHFDSSLRFARLIQKHYAAHTPIKNRGARQDIFAVLWKPTMPRVLTEMGFISNESDRKYLFSEKGQNQIVKALFEAFREYRSLSDAEVAADSAAQSNATPTSPASVPEKSTPATVTPPKTTVPAATPSAPAGRFYIQLAASRGRVSADDGTWGPYRGKVVERQIGGLYKYSLGPYYTREEAAEKLTEVRRTKFRDAFIVEY
jgi:N-acetylmuramoyl-L-alanine amidase